MSHNTISVSPLPESTSIDKIKEIFAAFSVKNVHIDGKTAYVEFADQGDLQNLDIQFDDYVVTDLNDARIDKAEFDWSKIHKQPSYFSELKSQSSDQHHDLMAADIDNLIVIENCDHQKINSLSVDSIRQIFKDFHSVNRIVKRNNDVIVEFTDAAEIEKLEGQFNNLNVPQLGYGAQIQKVDNNKISPEDFVNQWSKIHNESMITQESTNLGYKEEKQSTEQLNYGSQLGYGSMEEKPAHKVLHDDIIPSFDKKTSMEVNFINEQSELGIKQESSHEAIPQATTHQQLDYTTELKIDEDQHKLGYDKQVEQEALRRQEQERKQKQEEQNQRKIEEEHRKAEQQRAFLESERKRLIELQQQKKRFQQEQRRKRQELQNKRKQQEQEISRKKEEEDNRRQHQEQQKRKQLEQKRLKQEQEQRIKRKSQEQTKKKLQQQRLSQELKEKLDAQKLKFETQNKNLGYQQEIQKQQKHQIPTESENAAQETEVLKKVEQSIEKQLGYAVNKAKQESANLLQAGLDLLKKKQQKVEKIENIGYKKQQPRQIGLNLVNQGLEFLKGSYQKFQEHFGQNVVNEQSGSKISELGFEKWSVKPDVSVLKPVAANNSKVLRTLVTVTLFIWIIFLLMQDTSQEVQTVSEIEIPTSTV